MDLTPFLTTATQRKLLQRALAAPRVVEAGKAYEALLDSTDRQAFALAQATFRAERDAELTRLAWQKARQAWKKEADRSPTGRALFTGKAWTQMKEARATYTQACERAGLTPDAEDAPEEEGL